MRRSAKRAQGFALLAITIFLVAVVILPRLDVPAAAQSAASSAVSQNQSGKADEAKGNPDRDGVGPKDIRSGHILVRFKASPSQDVLNRLGVDFAAQVEGTIPGV